MNKLIIVGCFLLLSACASSDNAPVNYYFLDNETSFITGESLYNDPSLPLVTLHEVTVSPLLSQPNLLVQLDDGDLHYALEHVWAEPLVVAIPNVVVKRLRQRNEQYRFESGSEGWFGHEKYHLVIDITTFHPNASQEVLLKGKYSILTVDDELVLTQTFSFSERAKGDSHAHAVTAMASLLLTMTDDINRHLSSL